MNTIKDNIADIRSSFDTAKVTLIAVSKTYDQSSILEAYNCQQRDFGENKVQEMVDKQALLPSDIQWHLIGHLQTNKVKYIASFVHLIHAVDSLKLLREINKQALKCERIIHCLLQIYIADEETKFGLTFDECMQLISSEEFQQFHNIKIIGLMGMSTNTKDQSKIHKEFKSLNTFYYQIKKDYSIPQIDFQHLSMGMSSDYIIAIAEGSNMIRVGSAIFGNRTYA